jgi:SM-20-related protein
MGMGLSFSDNIASRACQETLARDGHVQITDILTPQTASVLTEMLKSGTPWARSISVGGKGSELPAEQFDQFPPEQQRQLMEMVWSEARSGFQYMFDRFRFFEHVQNGASVPPIYAALNQWLNAPSTIEQFRRLTGDDEITMVDGQATRYLPGHFLTLHDDRHGVMGRRFAYVLNLTENWRADWGGLLLFHQDNCVSGGLMPLFNTLNVFRVPQMHSVSVVAPYAGEPRLAITGWMRTN